MASEALRYQVQLGDYGTLDKKLIDVQIVGARLKLHRCARFKMTQGEGHLKMMSLQ